MRALKSILAKQVLADPVASQQMRRFLGNRSEKIDITLKDAKGKTILIRPRIVPKAG
jgi:hypothetical protein